MAFSKSVNLAHAQRAVPCNVCEDEVPGEYYCIECKHTLCTPCEKLHKKFTKGHNVVLRSQLGDKDTTILTCADHGEQASCHCETCYIPVCIKCVTGKHTGHIMSDLADVLEREKKLLRDDIKAMQRALPTLKNQNGEILIEKENYKKKIKKILKDMEHENQAAIIELQRIHKERVDHTISIQDSHLTIFDFAVEEMKSKINSYENRISEYEDTIAKNSLPALRNVAKGKLPLPGKGSKPKLPHPPTFVPGHLQSIGENLGKLHISASLLKSKQLGPLTIVSKFKCPLEGSPRICITKKGDVWLGGYESRELVMVGIKGQVLMRMNIQNRPYAMIVMECGDVIISYHHRDSSSVRKRLGDGRVQNMLDTSPYCSYGLHVTAEQKILICIEDGRVLRINDNGTDVRQVYKGSHVDSAIHAVEDVDGNIYISDCSKQTVVKVNKDGKVLSTISHTTGGQQLGGPVGLVVDKMDNVLFADFGNHCVYIISHNQQIRELVGHSNGIKGPQWLAVDNDNNLWITQRDGNVHVVKYLSP